MTPRAVPVTGSAVWAGAGITALAVLASAGTLHRLVAPGPWWPLTVVTVVAALAATALMRTRMRSRAAPTGWAAGGLALLVLALYGGTWTGLSLPAPTPDSVGRVRRLVESGLTAVVEGAAPVEPVRGLELLVVVGVVLVALGVDLLALGLGRAGLAGAFLLPLWGVAAAFDRPPPVGVAVLAGTAYLLLLTLTRPAAALPGGGWTRDARRGAAVAAGITVVAVAAGPVAAALPVFGTVTFPGWSGAPAVHGPLRLSTDLDMRADLAARSDRPILRYTTTAERREPLRLYTVTTFDGTEWQRDERGDVELARADGLLWPAEPPEADEALDAEETAIQIGDLDQDRLPIPLEPREVTLVGSWWYDAELDEVVGRGASTRDTSYVVRAVPRALDPDVLRADRTVADDAASDALALPASPFLEEVRDLATEITAEAGTDYDRAMALQSWFRSLANFTYSPDVPAARTDDAVWDFLTDRSGYCVQFATAMSVMARTLGMPSRLAVGFLPGELNPDVRGEYVVTGRQSHAWPEIWFEDAGWVRFEPTPAVQTGAPPRYADPAAGALQPAPQEVPTTSAAPITPTPPPTAAGSAGGGARGVSIGSTEIPEVVALGGVAVLVLAVGATVWLVQRARRRHADAVVDPEAAWARLRDRAGASGVTWSDAATPRQAGSVVAGWYDRARDPAVPDGVPGASGASGASDAAARRALERLVAAVEGERYAPRPVDWDGADLAALVEEAVRPLESAGSETGASRKG